MNSKKKFIAPLAMLLIAPTLMTGCNKGPMYTVTFNTNGGNEIASQVVVEGGKINMPAEPTRANKKFLGWYSDESLSRGYDFSNEVTSDLTLYACWGCPAVFPTYTYSSDPTIWIGNHMGVKKSLERAVLTYNFSDSTSFNLQNYNSSSYSVSAYTKKMLRFSNISDPIIDIQGPIGGKVFDVNSSLPVTQITTSNYYVSGLTTYFWVSTDGKYAKQVCFLGSSDSRDFPINYPGSIEIIMDSSCNVIQLDVYTDNYYVSQSSPSTYFIGSLHIYYDLK